MPAGLTVYGEHGFVQITEAYGNLALRQKSTVTPDGNGRGSFTFSASRPFVCIQSADPVALLGSSNSGADWTVNFSAPVQAPFTVYVFDEPAAPSGQPGLQVFKPDGSLAFDSGLSYLKVVGVVTPPSGAPAYGQSWEASPLTAGNYAACLSYTRTGIYAVPGTDTLFVADHVYTTATGAGLKLLQYTHRGAWNQGDGSGLKIDTSNPPQIVLVDVSQL
ncbi:hypothetical protein ACQCQP_01705 [Ralstonia pseudosolanacearum]|uniref:hypothetical protein n=1 Tax=Ralstonia pseudosolanacearum TaxID=1310165 RepID=UPI003CF60248